MQESRHLYPSSQCCQTEETHCWPAAGILDPYPANTWWVMSLSPTLPLPDSSAAGLAPFMKESSKSHIDDVQQRGIAKDY